MAGLYVHIPFCKSRCIYCGFFSTTQYDMRQKYVDALVSELLQRNDYCDSHWRTVYLGGGTPSTLDASMLRHLFHAIDCSSALEVTMECNPDDVDDDFAKLLLELPVNRISMGAQTFDDDRLRFLRRRHSAADVVKAVERLRRVGISNISVDLMYGFPDETLDDWKRDVDAVLSLDVEHVSAYCLSYETGTILYKMREKGSVSEADEELTRSMYYMLIDRLKSAGYEHYEVSNFARPDRRSLHNSSYWTGVPYMGIGAGAHSYDGMSRQWNVENLPIYINKVEKGERAYTVERLEVNERYNDMVMLSLRTFEGLDLYRLECEFGSAVKDECLSLARKFVNSGLLSVDNGFMRLTREGLYVSDMIMSELMRV
ncbi:MAG: radical SAM family heme chaperone HemW [Prevotella sp.]